MSDLDNAPSCPICGSYDVQTTGKPDADNQCEYICNDCGEYFMTEAVEEEGEE
jgi:transposase-like protein